MFRNATLLDDSDSTHPEDGKENAVAHQPSSSHSITNADSVATAKDRMVQAHLTGLVKNLIESAR